MALLRAVAAVSSPVLCVVAVGGSQPPAPPFYHASCSHWEWEFRQAAPLGSPPPRHRADRILGEAGRGCCKPLGQHGREMRLLIPSLNWRCLRSRQNLASPGLTIGILPAFVRRGDAGTSCPLVPWGKLWVSFLLPSPAFLVMSLLAPLLGLFFFKFYFWVFSPFLNTVENPAGAK